MDADRRQVYGETQMEAAVPEENMEQKAVWPDSGQARPRPTDFLAYSRQYASEMGLDPDITVWAPQDFQSFLDWWLLRTMQQGIDVDAG